jgi:hypothetical protein
LIAQLDNHHQILPQHRQSDCCASPQHFSFSPYHLASSSPHAQLACSPSPTFVSLAHHPRVSEYLVLVLHPLFSISDLDLQTRNSPISLDVAPARHTQRPHTNSVAVVVDRPSLFLSASAPFEEHICMS